MLMYLVVFQMFYFVGSPRLIGKKQKNHTTFAWECCMVIEELHFCETSPMHLDVQR